MEINWRPGIGDPTVWGWITVAAYFVAAFLAVRAARASQFSGHRWQSEALFWILLAFSMLGLGINKQLDLQSLLTDLARIMAKDGGWYRDRHVYQEAVLLLFGVAGAIAILGLLVTLRRYCADIRIAALGINLVICFVVIRAASFHKVDDLIGRSLLGLNWNVILELPGILLVAVCAMRYSHRQTRARLRVKISTTQS